MAKQNRTDKTNCCDTSQQARMQTPDHTDPCKVWRSGVSTALPPVVHGGDELQRHPGCRQLLVRELVTDKAGIVLSLPPCMRCNSSKPRVVERQ